MERATRAQETKSDRDKVQRARNNARNAGAGKSFLAAKRSTVTGRLK